MNVRADLRVCRLVGLAALVGAAALAGEARLSEGPTGLAREFAGDKGIERHPDVIFVERFDEGSPAAVFMGDTGSLSLGGCLAIVAVLIKRELLLFLVGGVFVLETISVMLQVVSFKARGRRIFRMAPIHHHFELLGWAEQKVVVRLWIVGALLALLSLSTLKLQ